MIKQVYGEKGGIGYVRVSDRNFNTTVDTFYIAGVKYPSLQSASAQDKNGDGLADSIVIRLRKGQADGAFALDSWSEIRYSWPTVTPLKNAKKGAIDLFDPAQNIISLLDSDLLGGAGQGVLEMDFPEGNMVKGAILDSVGPAIQAASLTLDGSRDKDSLILTVSEPIQVNLTGTDAYLILKQGTTELPITADLIQKIDDRQYRFIFDRSKKIVDQEFVKFVFSGTSVTDLKKNKPSEINQWVAITKSGDKDATIHRAEMRDFNGDGYGDSVTVTLKLGSDENRFTAKSISGGLYSWPSTSSYDNLNISIFKSVTDSTFSFTGIKNSAGTGEGSLKLAFPNADSISGLIVDLVGPALRDSARFDNSNGDRTADTLTLKVTEQIDVKKLSIDLAYFQLAIDTINVESVVSKSVGVITSDSILTDFAKGELDKKAYAWVRFASFEKSVVDMKGNVPHSKSKWVPLVRKGTSSALNPAALFDAKGSGRGDEILVKFSEGSSPQSHKLADLKSIAYSWPTGGIIDTVKRSNLTISNGSVSFSTNGSREGFGSGSIALIFDDTTYTETIIDSVGPAIVKASRLWSEKSENDTVMVALTESIANLFASDKAYSVIIHGTSETSVKSKSTQLVNDSLRMVFPFGTVQENDSIALIPDGGIADLLGNKPHQNNQHIEIELVGGKKPYFVNAEMFDNDGNGTADSVVATIKLGSHVEAERAQDLSSAKASWPTTTDLKDAKGSAIDETTIKLTGMEIFATSGTGAVELTFPSGVVRGEAKDRVGPVILSAKLWEQMGGDDTLQVEFSEPIIGAGDAKTLLNINDDPKHSIKVEPYLSNTIWRFSFAKGTASVGDSVNIVSKSDIRDGANNPAHEKNRKVAIEMKKRPIAVHTDEGGFYATGNDGTMDQVQIVLAKEVDQKRIEGFTASFSWPSVSGEIKEFSIGNDRMTVQDSVLFIDLKSESLAKGMTFVDDSKFGKITLAQPDDDQIELHKTAFTGKDRMAPVLVDQANYRGKELTSDEEQFEDTLVLNYSEPIEPVNPGSGIESDIFILNKKNGDVYRLLITGESSHENSVVRHTVRVIRGKSTVPASGDKIAISGDTKLVKDRSGNVQQIETAFVPFGTVYLPASYEVVVYPNPFTVTEREYNNDLIEEYRDNSDIQAIKRMAVMVRPFGNRAGAELSGTISIFDAVGQVIMANEELAFQERTGVLLASFEGKNLRGRNLGSGLYRGVISVKSKSDDTEQVNVIPVMIGIKE